MELKVKANLKDSKIERIPFHCLDLDMLRLEDRYGLVKKRSRAKHNQPDYVNAVVTFDIETTTVGTKENPITWLYIWQVNIEHRFTIYGRTVTELKYFFSKLKEYNEGTVIVYVHNLSYEFQYLTGFLKFQQVLANGMRKPIKAISDNIEFRCSYMLSNLSLKNYCKQMGTEQQKLNGEEFNYKKVRTPSTELTPLELEYCLVDVESLSECIMKHMQMENDTLITIPMTSTGYVRREVRKNMYYLKNAMKECLPPPEVYAGLREAYRGGDCHANRFYAGKILKNVRSRDMKSAYPSAMCTRPYPVGQWTTDDKCSTYKDVVKLIQDNRYACVMHIVAEEVETNNPCPYLSVNKLTIVKGEGYKEDNGRLLKAQQIDTWLTDIDFVIFNNTYDFKYVKVLKMYCSKYGMLPRKLTDVVREYFKKKTQLKGVEGQEVYYNLAKAKLNSIYGMLVQVLDKPEIVYDNETGWGTEKSETYGELFYSDKFILPYSWGVWTSAWCRYMLYEGREIVGNDFVYCDTDSVKFIGQHDFSELNKFRESLALKRIHAVDKHGNEQNGGVYEEDGVYSRFATLGAKRYAYEDAKGLHITIAGVNKKLGAEELGSIENFRDGFVFKKSGKTIAKYNDNPEIKYYEYGGENIEMLPYISILESTYNMTLGRDYRILLEEVTGIVYNKNTDTEVSA